MKRAFGRINMIKHQLIIKAISLRFLQNANFLPKKMAQFTDGLGLEYKHVAKLEFVCMDRENLRGPCDAVFRKIQA